MIQRGTRCVWLETLPPPATPPPKQNKLPSLSWSNFFFFFDRHTQGGGRETLLRVHYDVKASNFCVIGMLQLGAGHLSETASMHFLHTT